MNENLFASFITPTLIGLGLPVVILIIAIPSIFFLTPSRLLISRISTVQQWFIQTILNQIVAIHSSKGHSWSVILISLIIFISSTNLLGLLPHTSTTTTQLSINLGIAIPPWAGAVILGFSTWYMHTDPNLEQLSKYFLIFLITIIILVSAHNLIQLFIGWEVVGLSPNLMMVWALWRQHHHPMGHPLQPDQWHGLILAISWFIWN